MKTIPSKWKVKNCPEVGAYYDRKCGTNCYKDKRIFKMLPSHNIYEQSILEEGEVSVSFGSGDYNVPEITLEQFRQLTNTQNQTVMKKCIKGSEELRNYLKGRKDNPAYLEGNKIGYYYQDELGNWNNKTQLDSSMKVVSFTDYFKNSQSNANTTMKNATQPTAAKPMSITKTENVLIGKKKREITITVLIQDGKVRAGYSVRNPEDKKSNPELAKQISTGRALADKTNLVDMIVGIGMDKKYILYAIAEQLFRELNSGTRQIKGVK